MDGPPTSYLPRKSYEESFYHAVFGPSLTDNRDLPWLCRNDAELVANLPPFGDGAGNAGQAPAAGAMKVYRNGELPAENTVPGYGHRAGRPVEVSGGRALRLTHPKDAKSVSLRAKAGDRTGGTVERTVIDACLPR